LMRFDDIKTHGRSPCALEDGRQWAPQAKRKSLTDYSFSLENVALFSAARGPQEACNLMPKLEIFDSRWGEKSSYSTAKALSDPFNPHQRSINSVPGTKENPSASSVT